MDNGLTGLMHRVTAVLLIAICVFSFAGCGKKGTSSLFSSLFNSLKNLGISETYEIENGEIKYILEMKEAKKPITIKMVLEDLGGNIYNFKLAKGSVNFATVEVKGNTMTYYVGEGENKQKMVFKRK